MVTKTGERQELDEQQKLDLKSSPASAAPWNLIVWNDPINLMSYVTYVFMKYFGFTKEHAHSLMLKVHNNGSTVVAQGSREQMELHAQALHGYGLWATLQSGDSQ